MNLLSFFVLAFAFQVAQPVPDPIPNAVVEGSVVDIIAERRIDAMVQKLEAQQQSFIEKAAERIEQRTNGKLAELVESVRTLREEREGVLSSIKDFRKEHGSLLERMQSLSESVANASKSWTPLQNLVDRLTSLVWKLFWFICVLGGLVLLLGLVGLYLYSRLKGFVAKEISSIIPNSMKPGN